MSEYTKEPWKSIEKGHIYTESGLSLVAVVQHCASKEANARRIVACVNACAGISTDVLEAAKDGAALLDLVESAVRLTQQRDRLAAELEDWKQKAIHWDGMYKRERDIADRHAAMNLEMLELLERIEKHIDSDTLAKIKEGK